MNSQFKDHSDNGRYIIIMFIIWPFLSFVLSLMDYRSVISRRIVYGFLIYFGLSFIVGMGMDSSAYVVQFHNNTLLPFSEFYSIVFGLYSNNSSIDVVEPFLSFLISRISSDQGILFAVYAAFFGFFYLKSINLLYEQYKNRSDINSMIFFLFFIGTISITNINGFRMWSAAWVFFYGAYYVIIYRKKKYFLLTLFAALIHWSYYSVNMILLIYFLIGNKNILYFPLAITSIIYPSLLVPVFKSLSLFAGGAIQARYSGYTNEDYVTSVHDALQETSWFVTLSQDLIFYYLQIALLIVFIINRKNNNSIKSKNIFSFSLLFLSFVNFGKIIPSFGNRFQVIFVMFSALYIFFYFIKVNKRKINILTILGLFPMLLYILVEFRIGSEVINSWIFMPGFGLPLITDGISLADFLFSS